MVEEGASAVAFLVITLVLVSLVSQTSIGSGIGDASESGLVGIVDGQSAYNDDLELEKMTLDPSTSKYSFRAAGSPGANAVADWVLSRFKQLGLEARTENFDFTTWNVASPPKLFIDTDNDPITTADQMQLASFMPKHMAFPTGKSGIFGQIVVLPLPNQGEDFPAGFWDNFSTKGKVVAIGREFADVKSWRDNYIKKMNAEPPAAIIQTWWFPEHSWVPTYSGSQEGRLYWYPGTELRYWNLKVSVGMVSYYDGLKIRNLAEENSVSAAVVIDATVGEGVHRNVVAELKGSDPSKIILFSSHYDSVVTAGFGDDGAGVAGIIELARAFANAKRDGIFNPPYTLMFVAFAAEELWLVGSSYFVQQHKSEMSKFAGVINLDPIGGENLAVSESPSKLHEIVIASARDLGVPITTVPRDEASSDNWSFELPRERQDALEYAWSVSVNMGGAEARPAVWLGSSPLYWTDALTGKAGWIHTPYDNASSTLAYGWMKPKNMEAHLKVAALSAFKIATSSTATQTSKTEIIAGLDIQTRQNWFLTIAVVLAVILATMYAFRRRHRHTSSQKILQPLA